MNKMIRGSSILSLTLVSVYSVSAHCATSWESFLKNPNKSALAILESSITADAQRCSWGNPTNQSVAPTEEQGNQLFGLIVRGNESAFRAALLILRCLDGGELEDFYRSAGNFFEVRPLLFLKIVKENSFSDSLLDNSLTMLPLDTVDHIDNQIYIISNRIKLLSSVNERSLGEIKERGLSILKKDRETLCKIKYEMENKKSTNGAGASCLSRMVTKGDHKR